MSALSNKHVVVFGGSSGIGYAVARAALESGAAVTILGRTPAKLADAASRLGVRGVPVDVEDEAAVLRVAEELPLPDHIYLASGAFVGGGVLDGDMASFRSAFEARIWGSVHVVRAFAPRMRGPASSFVLTGGVSTDRPVKGAWVTAVATAATQQLARCLALELAPIRCNAIAPGWTDTPMWDPILGDSKDDTFAAVSARTPIGRIGRAQETAAAVLALMTNEFINGTTLAANGGLDLV
jgi:NAD(P)-dependent dehydrogenase (short-subunit alcohol dehydrogenase family)